MKKLLASLLTLALLAGCTMPMNARNYNNEIIDIQGRVIDKQIAMVNAMDQYDLGDSQVFEDTYTLLATDVDVAIGELESLKPFNGDATFRDSAVQYMQWIKKLLDEDYSRLLETFKKDGETITDADYDSYNQIIGSISTELDWLDAMMESAQQAFAQEHSLSIEE